MARITTSVGIEPDIYNSIQQVGDFNVSKFLNQQLRIYFGSETNHSAQIIAKINMIEQEIDDKEAELQRLRIQQERAALKEESAVDTFMNAIGDMLVRQGLGWDDIYTAYCSKFGETSKDNWADLKAQYGY